VLTKQGNYVAALQSHQKAVPAAEAFAHSVPANSNAQYALADAYSGMGDAIQKQALKGTLPLAKQIDYWTQARSWYERSSAEWKQVRNPGKLSPIGYDTRGPGVVAEKLARCDSALNRLKKKPPAK
jgi:hypothetical protein